MGDSSGSMAMSSSCSGMLGSSRSSGDAQVGKPSRAYRWNGPNYSWSSYPRLFARRYLNNMLVLYSDNSNVVSWLGTRRSPNSVVCSHVVAI